MYRSGSWKAVHTSLWVTPDKAIGQRRSSTCFPLNQHVSLTKFTNRARMNVIIQRSPLFFAPGLVKIVPAVARLFCLALPGPFLTMFAQNKEDLCSSVISVECRGWHSFSRVQWSNEVCVPLQPNPCKRNADKVLFWKHTRMWCVIFSDKLWWMKVWYDLGIQYQG